GGGTKPSGVRELVFTGARDGGVGAGGRGELQPEDRYAAGAEEQHVVAMLHPATRDQPVPRGDRRAGQGRSLFVRIAFRDSDEPLLGQAYVLGQHAVELPAESGGGVLGI